MTSPVQNTVSIFAFRADKQQQLVQAQVVTNALAAAKEIAASAPQAASGGGVDIKV